MFKHSLYTVFKHCTVLSCQRCDLIIWENVLLFFSNVANILDCNWEALLDEEVPKCFEELGKLHKEFMQRIEDSRIVNGD